MRNDALEPSSRLANERRKNNSETWAKPHISRNRTRHTVTDRQGDTHIRRIYIRIRDAVLLSFLVSRSLGTRLTSCRGFGGEMMPKRKEREKDLLCMKFGWRHPWNKMKGPPDTQPAGDRRRGVRTVAAAAVPSDCYDDEDRDSKRFVLSSITCQRMRRRRGRREIGAKQRMRKRPFSCSRS